jgi:hypothetical protein
MGYGKLSPTAIESRITALDSELRSCRARLGDLFLGELERDHLVDRIRSIDGEGGELETLWDELRRARAGRRSQDIPADGGVVLDMPPPPRVVFIPPPPPATRPAQAGTPLYAPRRNWRGMLGGRR